MNFVPHSYCLLDSYIFSLQIILSENFQECNSQGCRELYMYTCVFLLLDPEFHESGDSFLILSSMDLAASLARRSFTVGAEPELSNHW